MTDRDYIIQWPNGEYVANAAYLAVAERPWTDLASFADRFTAEQARRIVRHNPKLRMVRFTSFGLGSGRLQSNPYTKGKLNP